MRQQRKGEVTNLQNRRAFCSLVEISAHTADSVARSPSPPMIEGLYVDPVQKR